MMHLKPFYVFQTCRKRGRVAAVEHSKEHIYRVQMRCNEWLCDPLKRLAILVSSDFPKFNYSVLLLDSTKVYTNSCIGLNILTVKKVSDEGRFTALALSNKCIGHHLRPCENKSISQTIYLLGP
eukprot:NODE_7_length_48057_cov_0.322240.p29 type:complete len:124 gc:universal NODE_7_length_48057_cov_0.322240:3750-3379(-)